MKRLSVQLGITPRQIDQLIHYSNTDPQVIKFTSDQKRFKDRASYEEWRKKGRVIYTLSDKQGDLLGIIWFGEKKLSQDYEITFAIRLYGKARGKGLAQKFMEEAWKLFQPKSGVWLETYENNIPAIKVYEKFGFRKITKPDEKGRILMVWERL